MKKILFLGSFLFSVWFVSAQNRETITVDTFNKISFGVPGKAYVKQGSTQKVELEGSRDAMDRVEVIVDGGQLKIRQKERWGNWNWGREDRITAYITVKDIRALAVAGSGDMEVQTKIVTGNLDLKVSGSGSLKAEMEADDVLANVSGSGMIRMRGKCNNLESSISGSGDVEANVSIARKLDAKIAGSGNLIASGKASSVKVTISGSGNVRAGDLEADVCEVKIAGSGSVEVNVKNELNANISGSGSVRYKGNPNHVNTSASGSGKVRKIS